MWIIQLIVLYLIVRYGVGLIFTLLSELGKKAEAFFKTDWYNTIMGWLIAGIIVALFILLWRYVIV